VQIAESVNGRRRIVRHVGSARDEAELGLLVEQAHRMLSDEGQGVLELGLVPTSRRAMLVPPPAGPALFTEAASPGRGPERVLRARVVKTVSAVLFDALAGVYSSLGFDAIDDEVFRDLVIARVVEPTSLSDIDRVMAGLGRRSVSLSTRKRTLRRCGAQGYREQLAQLCFAHAAIHGDVSLVLYDVTTLYFEADNEDALRRVGYSKERRVDPQVVVGLLVDRAGFPLEIGCFAGNKAEKHTLVPIIDAFKNRHQIEHMAVVADAGMLSAANLNALDEAGYKFIVGSRQTKAPIDLESHFHWHGDAFTDAQIIDTLTPKTGPNTDNDRSKRAEPVWDPTTHPGSWRAVWAYSTRRSARDNKALTAQENRARAVVAGERPTRKPRFVKTAKSGLALDETALARARRLAGLKGYVTNIPAAVMPAPEVIASYHDLWQVEQSFRMTKSDLAARPMFARTRDAIEAHLTIVFAALAVSRTVQDRTGLSIRRVLRTLKPLRSALIDLNGLVQTFPPALGPNETAILNNLNHTNSRH
jgi:hypothetical protein